MPSLQRLPSLLSLCGAAALAAACASAHQPAARGEPSAPPNAGRMGMTANARLAAALADVSPARIRATDSVLVSFGTRHTMSDTLSPTRGIGAARRWIHATLERYARACGGCLRVENDGALMVMRRHPRQPTVNIVDVLGWLPGRDSTRVVVIGGHYDSCICSIDPWNSTSDAPGANDDGSGSAAVIELARVFSRHFPHGLDASVIFALYDGEEEGLYGSRHLAARLQDAGYQVAAAMTDDIVGNVTDAAGHTDSTSVRVFGGPPANGMSRDLARYAWAAGAVYEPGFTVRPIFRLDRIGRGGDHIPFYVAGDPALRFTEALEDYDRQHLPADRRDHVDPAYVARVARLNGAVVGSLAMAPAPPESLVARRDRASSGGESWTLTWPAVTGAAGYEVLLRGTTAAAWERVIPVGKATSYRLTEQLDDLWAGVRSVGADGSRSLAVEFPPPPRPRRGR